MSPLLRDPHPACARCRGIKCTADVTCDICKDWSVAQRSYSVTMREMPQRLASPSEETP